MAESNGTGVTVIPSNASRPDLDWSQVRETLLMLNLAIAQIEIALKDSSGSVDILANSFTNMYGDIMALVQTARTLPDSTIKQTLEAGGDAISGQMQHAIVAFQFYDRLTQRLSHVSRSLDDLTSIVNDAERIYNPFAWLALQQKIRSKYSMEEEKVMFDTLLRTGNVQEALDQFIASKHQQTESDNSDIELF